MHVSMVLNVLMGSTLFIASARQLIKDFFVKPEVFIHIECVR